MKNFVLIAVSLTAVLCIACMPTPAQGVSMSDSQAVAQWQSDIRWGILEQEKTEFDTELKVKTLSKNSAEITWKGPSTHEPVIAYQILKKTKVTDYVLLHTTPHTSFVDYNVKGGNYYGYKIVPIFQEKKLDPITKHGIDRNNYMHDTYMKGQELLAKETVKQHCSKCYDVPFAEINDIKWYDLPELDKRQDPTFQKRILEEIQRAQNTFSLLYLNY